MEDEQSIEENRYLKRTHSINKEKIVVIAIGLALPFLLVNMDFS